MAHHLSDQLEISAPQDHPVITPRAPGEAVPVTRAQRHILLDIVRGTEGLAYHEPMVIDFHGPSTPTSIAVALRGLLDRHEALRTTFTSLDDAPTQVIHIAVDPLLPTADLSHLEGAALEQAIRGVALGDAAIPFDLERAPLVRGRVIATAPDRHRLALTIHHALFDGRSLIHALAVELPVLHAAALAGRNPDLPPPPAQYGDYASAEAHAGRGSHWDDDLEYWRAALAGGTSSVTLPVDRAPVDGAARPAAAETIEIEPAVMEAVERIARAHATSTYGVLLAALFAQLRRYGSANDVTIGSIVDTRESSVLAGMVGYCINSVALRAPVALDEPFAVLLDRIADIVCHAYEHAATPFEMVAQALDGRVPGTDKGRFHVLFSLQPSPPAAASAVSIDYLPPPAAKADLFVEVELSAGAARARFTYDASLFDPATIRAMTRHWSTLLREAAAAPETRLGDLPMLDGDEAEALARCRKGPDLAIPDRTLQALIGDTIARRPNHLAVTGGSVRWTYAELDARADAIAAGLQQQGVEPGALVAFCLERSPAMIAVILGILRTGAAYVPIDPSFPAARLAMILDDARPAAIIADSSTVPSFTEIQGPMLDVEVLMTTAGRPQRIIGTKRDLAYIIYTSGSTGVPKGVEIEHIGVVNIIDAMRRAIGFTADDVMLGLARLTFDMSVPDVFLPLIVGGTIAVAPSEAIADPALLATLIDQSGTTVMQATPATWQSLIADGWRGKPGLIAVSGGEALGRALADDLLDRGLRVWNGYGPTEASVYITVAEVRRGGTIDIGLPIANTETLIVDDAGGEVPFNIPGHLLIAGIGLARGYRDAEITARAFIMREGRRWYRSGDLALRRLNGRIEWLGRNDGQIKIRGFRIDIGDVEAAICTCPGIALAGVTAVEGIVGSEKELAAFVVAREGGSAPDFAQLRRHLSGIVPKYMIPTRYAVLDALPLSSSGKIQRSALAAMQDRLRNWSSSSDAPEGPIETAIAEHWREVLGIDSVGATDDFFDLGGHSLLAARLIGRLSAAFDKRLPLATLTRAPTVRRLANLIAADAVAERAPRTITIGTGQGAPLFWIDATPNFRANGFRDFAAALGDSVRLVGLPVDTERFAEMPEAGCITSIANDMAAAVVSAEREGPYRIGGWCNGALLALYVADALVRQGHEVDVVVMLDAANQARFRHRAHRLQREIAQLFYVPADERRDYMKAWLGGYASRFRRRLRPAGDEADALLDLTDRFMRVLRDTDLPTYDGRTVLIGAVGGGRGYANVDQWDGVLTGPIDLVRVQGGHESVLHPPYVAGFAAQLLPLLGPARMTASRKSEGAAAATAIPARYAVGDIGTSPV